MSTDSKKLAELEDVSSEQQDEVCARYEGSYMKIFFMLVCAIAVCVLCICTDKPRGSSLASHLFLMLQILQYICYVLIPFLTFCLIEIVIYIVSGVNQSVVICKNHFEYNQNRIGLLNYRIKYTDIDKFETVTVHGNSGYYIYFKERLPEKCFLEFRNNNLFASLNKVINKGFLCKNKMQISTSSFKRSVYEKICKELMERTSDINKVDTTKKSTEAA